ncbi:molecular chaperone HscC [Paraburkholderia nemoris]|uniref:molecular chaperone HscC n=1 Tax=Paraburkholderia nemoris TaxID=2793076 RepID=UPI0038B7BA6C
MPSIIGIDLGTTHSLAAVWRNNEAALIPNALGDLLTPSCVSIDDDGSILVGRPAHDRLHTHPERTAANFKRYMGTNRNVSLGVQTLRPEELSSLVLKSLKADAEAFLGETVSDAVIAVPAYFSDAQRKATRIAGELAGLNVLRLVNEPTAASLAYGVHQRDSERKFLIFDLGGGTFDVSVLDFFEGVMEVRASTGDNFLGGEDFTEALVELFCQRNRLQVKSLTPIAAQRLHQQAERAKRLLTQSGADSVTLKLTVGDDEHSLELDALAAERTCEHLLQRLRKPVERALRDSKIAVDALDEIILVGGASRMPMVRKLVSKMFGRLPAANLNPDEVVALGAAVQAGLVTRDAGLDEMVLTDVAPYSLGIDTAMQVSANQYVPGHFLPIIERNTIVPVSRMQRIFTVSDRQQVLSIKVFQGDARLTVDNVPLGEFTLEVPVKPAGQAGADAHAVRDREQVALQVVRVDGRHAPLRVARLRFGQQLAIAVKRTRDQRAGLISLARAVTVSVVGIGVLAITRSEIRHATVAVVCVRLHLLDRLPCRIRVAHHPPAYIELEPADAAPAVSHFGLRHLAVSDRIGEAEGAAIREVLGNHAVVVVVGIGDLNVTFRIRDRHQP